MSVVNIGEFDTIREDSSSEGGGGFEKIVSKSWLPEDIKRQNGSLQRCGLKKWPWKASVLLVKV